MLSRSASDLSSFCFLVSVLARSFGYTSESAFSNAFKRVTGHAPKRYRSIVRASGSPGKIGYPGRAGPAAAA